MSFIRYFVSMPEEATSYNGNNVIILKFIDPDPAKADFVRDVKTAIASTDILVAKYPLTEGLEIIMDMEGLTLGHLAKIDFSALRVFMTYYQVNTKSGIFFFFLGGSFCVFSEYFNSSNSDIFILTPVCI